MNAALIPRAKTIEGAQERREMDAEFRYEDGTVILFVHNIEICVDKGVLAQHPLFFHDVFSLRKPRNPDGNPCPIVRLTDSPKDVRYVLQAYLVPVPRNPRCGFICIPYGRAYQYTM